MSNVFVQIVAAFFLCFLTACPLFRSTGGVVQSVGDGAGEVADGVGNAVSGTGRAINRGVNGTVDSLE